MSPPVKSAGSSTRKRYYLVSEDLRRNPSDYEILNEAEIYPCSEADAEGKRHSIRQGARSYALHPMGSTSYGLPQLRAKPRVFIALKNKPLDIYGFHTRRVVSDRAKQLLDEIDPTAFDFAECETITHKGLQIAPYWLMDIARAVDGFDEVHSVFETAKGVDGLTGEPYLGPHFSALHDIQMSPDIPVSHHAFLLQKFRLRMVFDEVIVDAWRASRFSGACFNPLQPPTASELESADLPAYWRSREPHR